MFVVHAKPKNPNDLKPLLEKYHMEGTWLQDVYAPTTRDSHIKQLVLFVKEIQEAHVEVEDCTIFEIKTVSHFDVTRKYEHVC